MNLQNQLSSAEDFKKLSISLKKSFQEKGIDIKQSLILEAISKSLVNADWNTFNALLTKNTVEIDKTLPSNSLDKNIEKHFHVDNGGFTFSFNKKEQKMSIESGFFGYSSNIHHFYFNQELCNFLRDVFEDIKSSMNNITHINQNNSSYSKTQKDTTITYTEGEAIEFKNPYNSIQIPIFSIKKLYEYDIYFSSLFELQILPLNERLLSSMAMRYDHSFGLMNEEEQKSLIEKMTTLYELYSQGFTNEEISEKTNINKISISQIREEVTGEGFYKKPKTSMFK